MSDSQGRPRATRRRQSTSRLIAVRTMILRCGAFLVVSILLCVPALTRALERTLTTHTTTGFRFSKNIERPVDKFRPAPTPVALSVSDALEADAPPIARFYSSEVVVNSPTVVSARPVRASPAPTSHT